MGASAVHGNSGALDVEPRFSKCGPWTMAVAASPRNLSEMQNPRLPTRPDLLHQSLKFTRFRGDWYACCSRPQGWRIELKQTSGNAIWGAVPQSCNLPTFTSKTRTPCQALFRVLHVKSPTQNSQRSWELDLFLCPFYKLRQSLVTGLAFGTPAAML
ncbi:uncharacterized protein LOC144577100 [Callithrix jacchus]